MSWPALLKALQQMGGIEVSSEPMMQYWFRMMAAVYGMVGAFFGLLAIKPQRYANMIGIVGILEFFVGLVVLGHGLQLGLSDTIFYFDTVLCLGMGAGIFLLRKSAASQAPETEANLT